MDEITDQIHEDSTQSTSSSGLIMEEKQYKDIVEGEVKPPSSHDSPDTDDQIARSDVKDIDILSSRGVACSQQKGKYSIFYQLSRAITILSINYCYILVILGNVRFRYV
jgi:hypothetical protein